MGVDYNAHAVLGVELTEAEARALVEGLSPGFEECPTEWQWRVERGDIKADLKGLVVQEIGGSAYSGDDEEYFLGVYLGGTDWNGRKVLDINPLEALATATEGLRALGITKEPRIHVGMLVN